MTNTSLAFESLTVLHRNLFTESFQLPQHQASTTSDSKINTVTYTFPSPCSSNNSEPIAVQESTITLLSALSLAKTNETTLAWETLRSLFAVQGTNGFLPKYRYAASIDKNNTIRGCNDTTIYITDTSVPCPNIFGALPTVYQSSDAQIAMIPSSGRIASVPYHTTFILQIYYQSQQSKDDKVQLEVYFQRLYNMHSYWMDTIMRHCWDSSFGSAQCYNVIHPWESMIDSASPLWSKAFDPYIRLINDTTASLFMIENQGQSSLSPFIPTNETIHSTMISLLQCHSTFGIQNNMSTTQYETALLEQCPFAMLDVTHLAALSKSNVDLQEMALFLKMKLHSQIVTNQQLTTIANWITKSSTLLMKELYFRQRFVSKLLHFSASDKTTTTYSYQKGNDTYLLEPSAFQLLAAWNDMTTSSVNEEYNYMQQQQQQQDELVVEVEAFQNGIITPLVQRHGTEGFNFACGAYPVVSWGDFCYFTPPPPITTADNVWIYPHLNYLLSLGLMQNGASGLGYYLQNSTLRLICNVSNSYLGNIDAACDGNATTFASAYRATPDTTISSIQQKQQQQLSICDMTSTQTAVIIHNILTPSKPFMYRPDPPIQHGWVLVLITFELIIAFSIGVSCLLLSLNLMSRLKKSRREDDDDDDAFRDNTTVLLERSFVSLLENDHLENLYEQQEEEDKHDDHDVGASYSVLKDDDHEEEKENFDFHTNNRRNDLGDKNYAEDNDDDDDDEKSPSSLSLSSLFHQFQSPNHKK